MYVQELKFEIKISETGERVALELIFVVDGVYMTEDKMLERIKEKLSKAAEGRKYQIMSWIRDKVEIPEQSQSNKKT